MTKPISSDDKYENNDCDLIDEYDDKTTPLISWSHADTEYISDEYDEEPGIKATQFRAGRETRPGRY